jgi:hypothetical protein
VFVCAPLALLIPDVGATLRLVAFDFLKWITNPWAIEQRAKDKELQQRLKEQVLFGAKRFRRPMDWIDEPHVFYLGSGIPFMFAALLELFQAGQSPPTEPTARLYPFASHIRSVLVGLAFLALEVLGTEQVLSFMMRPERLGQVSPDLVF